MPMLRRKISGGEQRNRIGDGKMGGEGQKVQTPRYTGPGDVMYSTEIIANSTVLYI